MENFEITVPSSPITLLSGAKLYKDIPETLTYSYVVTEDEELLYSNKYIESGDVFNKLVEHKIQEKINVNDLLVGDFNQILIALRISAYGEDYKIKIVDPDTGEISSTIVDLSKLEQKGLEHDFNENGEFSLQLPLTGRNITFKIPTVGLGDMINKVATSRKGVTGVDTFITSKLEYLIMSIDGNRDKQFISTFVKKMPPRDRLAFMKEMDKVEPNIILECPYNSKFRGEVIKIPFSLGIDFFYPNY